MPLRIMNNFHNTLQSSTFQQDINDQVIYKMLAKGPGCFFNTTWEARRGKILPGLEFFPWVLSFLLEFLVFPWVFWIFLQFFCDILINFDIFPLEFNFSKIFVNKNAIKSATPSKILSFDKKINFFSWVFLIGGKILPEVEFFPWVFGLSFFLEF